MSKINKKDFNTNTEVEIVNDIRFLDFCYIDDLEDCHCGKFTEEEINYIYNNRPEIGEGLEIIKFRKYNICKVWYKAKNAEPIMVRGREVVFRAFWVEFKKGVRLVK